MPRQPKPPIHRVSVPFNAGRGLMRRKPLSSELTIEVSVPFNAGRGLMRVGIPAGALVIQSFSTLQCGSWIDAQFPMSRLPRRAVSVPFNAGRGLMPGTPARESRDLDVSVPFNAGRGLMPRVQRRHRHARRAFQYPSMRVVD